MSGLWLADAVVPPLLALAGSAMVIVGGAPNAWAISRLHRRPNRFLFLATFLLGLVSLIAATAWLVAVVSGIDTAPTRIDTDVPHQPAPIVHALTTATQGI